MNKDNLGLGLGISSVLAKAAKHTLRENIVFLPEQGERSSLNAKHVHLLQDNNDRTIMTAALEGNYLL